jgi:AAA+ superfamily predicted ATPase
MLQSFVEQLHTLLAAPYPYVNLVTYEEPRAVGLVEQLAAALSRSTTAWRPEEMTAPGSGSAEVCAALDAYLEALIEDLTTALRGGAAPNAGGVHLVIDAHPYLADPARVRRLRVLEPLLSETRTLVVFVSPLPVAIPELVKDLACVTMPMPDRSELEVLLEETLPELAPQLPRTRLASAALGLSAREAVRAFERARHLWSLETAKGRRFDWESAVVSEKRRLLKEGTALEFWDLSVGLDDVGGLHELKQWLGERQAAFSTEARSFGLPAPRGLLLIGVQGCGKTLAAKAIAGYWGIPLLRLDLGALFSGAVPPDEALRTALRSAEALSPAVLWVDEIEKGFEDADGETARILGSLLVWLQEKQSPVFFVATANRVQKLPPELLRRGRFDELFFVDLPDDESRTHILKVHLTRRGRDASGFKVAEIAGISEHFSGAELEQVVVAALYRAFGEKRELEQRDLVVAARQMVPLYALYEQEIKALRGWAQGRARPAHRDRKLTSLFGGAERR